MIIEEADSRAATIEGEYMIIEEANARDDIVYDIQAKVVFPTQQA